MATLCGIERGKGILIRRIAAKYVDLIVLQHLGEGVGDQSVEAVAKAMLEFCLQRVVVIGHVLRLVGDAAPKRKGRRA